MLEECSKALLAVEERIRQGETIYTKAMEVVFAMWEVLLEDETRENIKENAWQVDEKITAVKSEMKKFLLKENLTKIAEIK